MSTLQIQSNTYPYIYIHIYMHPIYIYYIHKDNTIIIYVILNILLYNTIHIAFGHLRGPGPGGGPVKQVESPRSPGCPSRVVPLVESKVAGW